MINSYPPDRSSFFEIYLHLLQNFYRKLDNILSQNNTIFGMLRTLENSDHNREVVVFRLMCSSPILGTAIKLCKLHGQLLERQNFKVQKRIKIVRSFLLLQNSL